jgi:hypothetical protein
MKPNIITRKDIQLASQAVPAGGTPYQSLRADAMLSDYSIAYRNDLKNLLAPKIAPIVPVNKSVGFYPIFGTENLRLPTRMGAYADKTEPEQADWSFSDDQYICKPKGLLNLLPDRWKENADSMINMDEARTRLLTEKLMLIKEYESAAILFNASNFPGRYEGLSGSTMWDNANSDITVQVRQAKGEISLGALQIPEEISLAVSYDVFVGMQTNAKLLTRYQYTTPDMLTAEMIAKAIGVKEINVGYCVVEEDDGTRTRVWGNFALFYYGSPTTEQFDPSLAKTFIPKGGDIKLTAYRDEPKVSDALRAMWEYDIKITSAKSGFLYGNVVTIPSV